MLPLYLVKHNVVLGPVLNCAVLLCLTCVAMFYFATFSFVLFVFNFLLPLMANKVVCDIGLLSVRPSVCHAAVLYRSGLIYHHIFLVRGSPVILVLSILNIFAKYRRGQLLQGVECMWVY